MVCRKQTKFDGLNQWLVKEVQLTAAQVTSCNTVPVKLLDSPGPGRFLHLIAGYCQLMNGTTGYDTNGDLSINYKSDGGGSAVTTLLANDLNQGTAGSVFIFGTIPEIENIAIANIENQPLTLLSSADQTAGDQPLRVSLVYEIVKCDLNPT